MIFYKLDYTIQKVLENAPSFEQKVLKDFAGQEFSKEEAKYVWERVLDHKWYVSEVLKRDIGLRVAAVDFVENFYEPRTKNNIRRKSKSIFSRKLSSTATYA